MQKLDHELQDSDIVELKCQKGKGPSKSWLKIVKTDQAKSRIKSYFYKKFPYVGLGKAQKDKK